MPFPSSCAASPDLPRRGSSSVRPWDAVFSSGVSVAEAMVRSEESRSASSNLGRREEADLDYKYLKGSKLSWAGLYIVHIRSVRLLRDSHHDSRSVDIQSQSHLNL